MVPSWKSEQTEQENSTSHSQGVAGRQSLRQELDRRSPEARQSVHPPSALTLLVSANLALVEKCIPGPPRCRRHSCLCSGRATSTSALNMAGSTLIWRGADPSTMI